jgi:CubicO group peptidase (beta-lactamase class C family)
VIRSFRVALATLVVAFSTASSQRSTITRAAFAPKVDSLAKAYLKESGAPSVAVAVIRGKDTLAFTAYGTANIAASRAATPAMIYEIGSITKQFTAAAVMRLVEQGKVKLDDDMSKYIPQFPLQGRHVTIRQLLNHTSGIHSYTSSPDWQNTWSKDLSPDEIIAFVARDTFDFAPGSAFRYNNTGYVMLGMVIEKASGQRYADYLAAQFFKPLGLKHTAYCPSKTTDPNFASGYTKTPSGAAPAKYLSLTHPFAAGALCSTVGDMVQWQRALAFGKVVSPASYKLMSTADTLNDGKKTRYGFGLFPSTVLGHDIVAHTGGIPGFATAAIFSPDDTLSIVTFTNYDAATPDPLAQNLLRIAYGAAPVEKQTRP